MIWKKSGPSTCSFFLNCPHSTLQIKGTGRRALRPNTHTLVFHKDTATHQLRSEQSAAQDRQHARCGTSGTFARMVRRKARRRQNHHDPSNNRVPHTQTETHLENSRRSGRGADDNTSSRMLSCQHPCSGTRFCPSSKEERW